MKATLKNFTPTFLVIFFLITIASATCSNSKRNVLGKRTPEKCNCQLAFTEFDSKGYYGYVVLSQDECGDTTFTGFFSRGFDSNKNYTFETIDDCGNVTHELGDLGIEFDNSGGTKPFRQKFGFDLNCTKKGILNTPSAYYKKRNCHYNKRQTPGNGGAGMQISGDPSATAPVYQ